MKVLLGMSGGVDSTFAVHKLKLMGYEVEGAVVKMHEHTEIEEARLSAESLGIALHVIDGTRLFEEKVVSDFVSEYKKGRTPNPCIVCNKEVKFKLLLEFALANGFDKIATGHYASLVKIEDESGVRHAVKRSRDQKKDQSYMLWRLGEDVLSHLIFPLEDTVKEAVKKEARELRLFSAERPESQEICFIPDKDYPSFIEKRAGISEQGNFVDENGKVLGRHKGIVHYTVGQRKGLGIALGERAFVTKIDPLSNEIQLSVKDSRSRFFRISGMIFSGLAEPSCGEKIKLELKHRYLAPLTEATLTYLGNGSAEVALEEEIRAVTPGQSAVFYKDDMVMAGGFIDS